MTSNNKLQTLLHGPLRNYLNIKNVATLAATNTGLRKQLKNNKNVRAFQEFQQIKQAFFLRAFVREFLQMYDQVRPNTPPPQLLLDIARHMVKLYNNLSNAKKQAKFIGFTRKFHRAQKASHPVFGQYVD